MPGFASVTVSDAELEAVLGHELTHIIHRDVRLLVVTIVFAGMISYLAQMTWRDLRVAGEAASFILVVAAAIGGIGYGLALALRFAISRRREYLADAGTRPRRSTFSIPIRRSPSGSSGCARSQVFRWTPRAIPRSGHRKPNRT